MEDETTVTEETSTLQEEQQEETTSETVETEPNPELVKAKEEAENQRKRAEKAEKALKERKPDTALKQEGLGPKDYLALTESRVSSEDFDEVVRVAKILDKPIADALKDKTMQSILKERLEERTTAAATQTRGGQRSGNSQTSEMLIKRAEDGDLPESDADIAKLAEAQMESRIKHKK